MYTKLRDCRTIDPLTQREEIIDIGIRDGKIDAVGDVKAAADRVVNVEKRFVVPALIDLHTHVYNLATSLGVDADRVARRSGVGVFVDAGSAGAGNFAGFREYVIKRSGSRIYSFLNIGFGGIPFFGIQKDSQAGEIPDISVADEQACVDCIKRNSKYIVGIKIRLSAKANGELGTEPLKIAKRCATSLGLPVMVHIGRPPPSIGEVLKLLDRGDILTHAFRSEPNSILSDDGSRVSKAVRQARLRGVIIDIGHGSGSFSYETTAVALADGVIPDTISTDIHRLSLDTPVHDLPATMTKFLNLGMGIGDIFKAVTYNPAKSIGRKRLGVIVEGAPADLVTIEISKLRTTLSDSTGKRMTFDRAIRPVLRVKGREVRKVSWKPPNPQ